MRPSKCQLTLLAISFGALSANAAPTYENPFIHFNQAAIAEAIDRSAKNGLLQVSPGNGQVTEIPEFPTRTLIRLGLALEGAPTTPKDRLALVRSIGPRKLKEVMKSLEEEGLLREAVRVAKVFKIDPLHILGPIVGENTFNGYIDRTLQNQYHQIFRKSDIENMSHRMKSLATQADDNGCFAALISNYWKWRCLLFYSTFDNSNRALMDRGFYSMSGNGTFGIAQMQPFLLWSLNDLVSEKMGYKSFDINDLESPMTIIFDNRQMLAYLAANAVVSIEVYKLIAGVDISRNPGLTTTLYNLGDEYRRAYNFNQLRTRSTRAELPKVNYLGWYVNNFEAEIRTYIRKYQ